MSKKLTRNAFRDYLSGYSGKSKVGSRDGETPLSRFIQREKINAAELPKWAQAYEENIRQGSGTTISAGAALSVLDKTK